MFAVAAPPGTITISVSMSRAMSIRNGARVVPLAETVEAFEQLRHSKKIRNWGVSNFDTADMKELAALPAAGRCTTNQVLYNLARRGVEWSLLPWQRERHIPTMAYSPIDQARLLRHKVLGQIAAKHKASPAQIALAWLLRQPDMIVIPKASDLEHVRENVGALGVSLDDEDLGNLNRGFPPPAAATPLQVQ